jgi:hypothetical protein
MDCMGVGRLFLVLALPFKGVTLNKSLYLKQTTHRIVNFKKFLSLGRAVLREVCEFPGYSKQLSKLVN